MGCAGTCPCSDDVSCEAATPRCDKNSGRCVPCLPFNDNCAPGTRCLVSRGGYVCTGVCSKDADCPRSDAGDVAQCCSGACLDVAGDPSNCGACGKRCDPPAHGIATCAAG